MTIFSPKERIKRLVTGIWTLIIMAVLVFLLLNPKYLSVEFIRDQLTAFDNFLWPLYLGLLLVRVPLLLPPTPFLFLGMLLFPEIKLLIVLLVMISSLISAAFFYYFAGQTGWYQFFYKKYPKQTASIENLMNRPGAVWIVVLWSFIPIAPGDLMCYIAGVVRMPFRILLIGILLGQFPLMLIYAYLGHLFF